jgi:hypothetical protein
LLISQAGNKHENILCRSRGGAAARVVFQLCQPTGKKLHILIFGVFGNLLKKQFVVKIFSSVFDAEKYQYLL